MASGNPEIIYGVQLLDDLHNYFPDILYNNQRFTTVQSVLQYITSSTRRRFDLFRYGRSQYTRYNSEEDSKDDDTAPVPNASAHGGSPLPRQQRTYASVVSGNTTATPSLNSLYSLYPTFDSIMYTPIHESSDGEEQINTNMALLSAIAGLFPTNMGQLSQSFLDPVPIFPTPTQIHDGTTIRTLVADLEDNCSICQDTMRRGESIRNITVCNHTFHRSCIDTWFVRNVRCPVCRHDIRESHIVDEITNEPTDSTTSTDSE